MAIIPFRRILCPIDFSDTSARALSYATAIATWHGAQLTVLHVATVFDEFLEPEPAGAGRPSRDSIIARLNRAIEQAGATGIDARPLVLEGGAAALIAHCAESMQADLLVMGTHGLGGFRRLLLGSVTEKVARLAPCPLLTVPPAIDTAVRAPIRFKRILCPIDFSASSLKALAYALELARQVEGCVTVLNAVEYLDPEEALEPSVFDPCREVTLASRRRRQHRIDAARERLHAQLALVPRTSCVFEEVVAINRAYKEILHRAADVDLIVMGAQGSAGIDLMLYGSNTQHVVRAAACPVLTVRAAAAGAAA